MHCKLSDLDISASEESFSAKEKKPCSLDTFDGVKLI